MINWCSVGSVHGGIVPSLPVGCQVSIHCDNDLRWLKINTFHSTGISNDGKSNYTRWAVILSFETILALKFRSGTESCSFIGL